jgi:signal transduction histidine kinase
VAVRASSRGRGVLLTLAISVLLLATLALLVTRNGLRSAEIEATSALLRLIEDIERQRDSGGPAALKQAIEGAARSNTADVLSMGSPPPRPVARLWWEPGSDISVYLVPNADGALVRAIGEWVALEDGNRLFVGQALAPYRAATWRVLSVAGYAVAALALPILIWLFLSERSLSRRLTAMQQACESIGEGDYEARVPGGDRADELGVIARSVNAMVDDLEALDQLQKLQTRFLSHEVRGDTAHIRREADGLRGQAADPAVEDSATRIATHADLLRQKSDALLNLSAVRIDPMSLSEFPLARLFETLEELSEAAVEDRGQTLTTNFDNWTVRADYTLLITLLTNLVNNAVKYAPPGSSIAVSASAESDFLILRVADNGPGVPADLLDRMFAPGERGHFAGDGRGHGYGLAMVQAIALRHGGSAVASLANPGLTVTVRLPDAIILT